MKILNLKSGGRRLVTKRFELYTVQQPSALSGLSTQNFSVKIFFIYFLKNPAWKNFFYFHIFRETRLSNVFLKSGKQIPLKIFLYFRIQNFPSSKDKETCSEKIYKLQGKKLLTFQEELAKSEKQTKNLFWKNFLSLVIFL